METVGKKIFNTTTIDLAAAILTRFPTATFKELHLKPNQRDPFAERLPEYWIEFDISDGDALHAFVTGFREKRQILKRGLPDGIRSF
jgi:hypothetical protein